MADQNYKLLIALLLKDQLSGGLKKTLTHLRAFGSESKRALRDYNQFRNGVAKPLSTSNIDKYSTRIKTATKETRAFGTEQGKLNKRFSQPINTKGLDSQIGKLREYRRELRGAAKDSERARTGMRGGMPNGRAPYAPSGSSSGQRRQPRQYGWGNRMSDAGDFYMNMRQVGAAFRDRIDSLDKYIEPAKKLLGAQTRFRMMGYSEADTRKGLAGVESVSRSIRGVNRTDAQEALNSLVNTIGGVDEALKFLPMASKYQANMNVMYGGQFGQADITRQIGNTFKALELLGVDKPTGKDAKGRELFTSADQKRMERYFDIIAQATTATGGEVNPSEFRNFAKYSRMAGTDLTPEGMMKLLPLIQQMGGSSTGTAMMTLYRNMIGGVIPSYKLRNWDQMGLLDKSKVEFSGKTDKVKRLLPGAIPIAQDLGKDPMAVADKLAAKFREFGIDTTDSDQVNKQLMSMFGDRTGVGALSQLINFRSSFAKETRNYERTPGINKAYSQLEKSPLMDIENYEKRLMEFRVSIGQNLLPMATNVMGALTPISEFFRDYPTVAKWTTYGIMGGKALGFLGETASIFGRTGKGAYNIFKSLTRGADDAASAFSRTERQALGLGRSVRGMSALKFGLGFAGVTIATIAVAKVVADYMELQEVRVLQRQASKDAADITNRVAPAPKPSPTPSPMPAGVKSSSDYLSRVTGLPSYIFSATPKGKGRDMSPAAIQERLKPENVWKERALIDYKNLTGDKQLQYATDRSTMSYTQRLNPGRIFPGMYPMESWTGSFDPVRVAKGLPATLDNAGTMKEFRKLLSSNVWSGNITSLTRTNTEEALGKRFPKAFEQSTEMLAAELFNTGQQSKVLFGAFSKLSPQVEQAGGSAKQIPPAFGQAKSAAQNFANDVNNIKLPTFLSGGLGGLFGPPKLDTGGIIKRSGLAVVHQGEGVLTADHTRALRDSLSSAHGSSQNHYNITLNVSGNVADPGRLSDEIVEKLAAKINDIEATVHDRRHFDRMYSKASRNERQRS